ncbi:MAG TPA: hypothetical protein VIO15_00310 [Bacteroidales bacterium]
MRNNKLHIIIWLVVLTLSYSGIVAQEKHLIIKEGNKTLRVGSATADNFMWIIDKDTVENAKADSLPRKWAVGSYQLSVIPFDGVCSGEPLNAIIEAKEDVTIGDGQVHFSQQLVNICPPSDVKPATGFLDIPIYFDGYTLKEGETYLFKYRIDNGPVQASFPYSKYNGVLTVDIQGLSVGTHYVRITMLYYKEGYSYQVDYSTSPKIPTMRIDIQGLPSIGDINYEK